MSLPEFCANNILNFKNEGRLDDGVASVMVTALKAEIVTKIITTHLRLGVSPVLFLNSLYPNHTDSKRNIIGNQTMI